MNCLHMRTLFVKGTGLMQQPTQMKRRASAIHPVTTADVVNEDDLYNTRLPTSTRRYDRTDGTQEEATISEARTRFSTCSHTRYTMDTDQ